MISQTVEYALRAIVTVAQHDGIPCTAQKIAEISQVPGPYLSKMMQGMVKAKLLTSKRGLHGGFVLAKRANELTVWDVVDAVEPLQRIRHCPLGISSHEGTLCPLHRHLDDAMGAVEDSFRNTTVAELLAQPGSVSPLCEKEKVVMIDLGNSAKRKPPKTTRSKKKN